MMRSLTVAAVVSLVLLSQPTVAEACTSFLVTKGASSDGSTMTTYAADSHELYGELYYRAPARHAKGSEAEVHDWDSGKLLGTIQQIEQTFRVVGNMNEHQVVIGETTFGGREELKNPKGGIDYGSMIYVSLQRAKTAREAIKVMAELAQEYGYASSGESFSIADPNEAWLLELIGKGPGSKGAVWVAMRVPEGHVTAHANQSRIRTFPRNDPDNCMFAPDVVSFARDKGYFTGADEDFSFVDAYNPPECMDQRVCEGRVWSFFNRVAPSMKLSTDYVKCKPGAAPLPLWIKPDAKLSPRDLMRHMRDHFEDTEFDMRKDFGAGPYALPYRWRPLSWKVDGNTYVNERATATQQTGFSYVSQSRSFLPNPVGGLLWFSVDDAASTVYVPMYSGINKISKPYAVGTANFHTFSWDSAFWVFNWVANQAYARYSDMIVDILKVQGELEGAFLTEQPRVEEKAVALYNKSPAAAEKFLTEYSDQSGDKVVARWRELGQQLLVKYLDGNVRNAEGKAEHPPYPERVYRNIVQETGDHLLVKPASSAAPEGSAPTTMASAVSSAVAKESAPPQSRGGCSSSAAASGPLAALLGLLALGGIVGLRRRQHAP